MMFVVGLGSSGAFAERNVVDGLAQIAKHPAVRVVSSSRLWQNPAMGGVTTARFVNAACVVETALSAAALLGALHAIESNVGRVRGQKNAARALDLDVLLGLDQVASVALTTTTTVPHPGLRERAFAVTPAIEAIERAGRAVPGILRDARPSRIPMFIVGEATR